MNASTDPEKAYQVGLELARDRSAALEAPSVVDRFARLPRASRAAVLEQLTPTDRAALLFAWRAWARPKQDPPEAFTAAMRIILWMMGRGAGKTRSAAERVKTRVYKGARTIGLIGPTDDDIEMYMLGRHDDDDGLLNIFPRRHKPKYVADPGVVLFHTGAVGYVHSAEKPEYRGPNLDTAWLDEIAMWRFLVSIWSNIEFATRKPGALPVEIIITTTPRPLQFLKDLVADTECLTLVGSTKENPYNDPRWLDRMVRKYGGTRLGEQELEAAILGDNPDALFYPSVIDATRVESAPEGLRVVIPVDPAISTEPKNDETGITPMGDDIRGHQYVLSDLSGRHKPEVWGKLVVDAYDALDAVAIVAERNRGGDLVESNVRAAMERKRGGIAAASLNVVMVHASRGKETRAEPVSTLHTQGLIHFVGHALKAVEDEVTQWNPKIRGPSPNRLDSFVWGSYYLGNLSGDATPDARSGFVGLERANATLQQRQAASSPAARLGPGSAPRAGAAQSGWTAGAASTTRRL